MEYANGAGKTVIYDENLIEAGMVQMLKNMKDQLENTIHYLEHKATPDISK